MIRRPLRRLQLALRRAYHALLICPRCRAGYVWLEYGAGGCHTARRNVRREVIR